MSSPNKFPVVSAALLEELERRFRDRIPDETDVETLLLRRGEITVVRLLRRQFDMQNTTVLSKDSK